MNLEQEIVAREEELEKSSPLVKSLYGRLLVSDEVLTAKDLASVLIEEVQKVIPEEDQGAD